MLTHHRKPVHLSLLSSDLPLWSTIETSATLYQKDTERFHLLLTEPLIKSKGDAVLDTPQTEPTGNLTPAETPRLLWLEISPYRVIMTMQGNGRFSYRHLWEQGIYGFSRYWLQDPSLVQKEHIRLRNFTRSLVLDRNPLPHRLRIEYELWSDKVQMGCYVLYLQIQH